MRGTARRWCAHVSDLSCRSFPLHCIWLVRLRPDFAVIQTYIQDVLGPGSQPLRDVSLAGPCFCSVNERSCCPARGKPLGRQVHADVEFVRDLLVAATAVREWGGFQPPGSPRQPQVQTGTRSPSSSFRRSSSRCLSLRSTSVRPSSMRSTLRLSSSDRGVAGSQRACSWPSKVAERGRGDAVPITSPSRDRDRPAVEGALIGDPVCGGR